MIVKGMKKSRGDRPKIVTPGLVSRNAGLHFYWFLIFYVEKIAFSFPSEVSHVVT